MAQITDTPTLKIGDVARITGLPVKRIRYYEQRGLLEPAARSEAGYRLYGAEEAARLKFIKRAKLLGLTLEEIRELVSLATACSRGEILPRLEEVVEEKIEETERKMGELAAFKENLLYYSERVAEVDPQESCDVETSFCGCLEATTGEGGAAGFTDAKEEKEAL
jgi:DNA-binding transcriptional MerR regulator